MIDTIGLPNIDPQTCQAVNPETSTRLRELVETYLAALELAGGAVGSSAGRLRPRGLTAIRSLN